MQFYSANLVRCALLASAFSLAAFAGSVYAQTYNLHVLHRFSGPPDDGWRPSTSVIFDDAGNLYGTTNNGGTNDSGSIYRIANDGTVSVIHSFEELTGPTGETVTPIDMVIDSSTGDIYGATQYGGLLGYGQIYKLAVDGTYTVLHYFNALVDGAHPVSVIRDPQGNLYGTLQKGPGVGPVLFEYSSSGTFRVLHAFGTRVMPVGSLVRDMTGNLFGVTTAATVGCGEIYKLALDGTFTTLYSFSHGADGCLPASLSGDRSGNLYGTVVPVSHDSTLVFKFAPDGTFTPLHSFSLVNVTPVLPVNGTLYAIAYATNEQGILFALAPDSTYTELYRFSDDQGEDPEARLTLKFGRLYGTNSGGGDRLSAYGTVFSFGVADP
ncbi:MAG TPA: choice-of-anchor tandem repeat GloVer-containing protein [Rhodanobacteraceae bacterium]|nr:choice-of-anchor tandem repeat GloVer-containing protein [Rhodanobacteraceae bacterium]